MVIVSYELKQIKSSNMNDNLTVISSNEDISFSIELRILKQHLAIDQNIVYMLLYLISNDEYKVVSLFLLGAN